MLEIQLNESSQVPLYKQIEEQVKQLIATDRLRAGERLPTVRQLSQVLQVNPATVARAYQELEREGVLGTGRRRGTVVLGGTPQSGAVRQSHLIGMVNHTILEALSQGYRPEELEAAFSLNLSRWRVEREAREHAGVTVGKSALNTINVVGSHDLALNLLLTRFKQARPDVSVDVTYAGSLGGLLALQEGTADMAGIHLLDEETGEYNYPYVRHVLQDIEVAIVHLAYRIQVLMFAKGNPRNVKGLEDLKRPDITFINRQKGSGTRVALDFRLRQLDIAPHEVKGYDREVDTHLAVALSIARREADVGLGIEAAARSCEIDFIPIAKERFDLVMPVDRYRSQLFAPLLTIIGSEEFKKVVAELGGYDISETGSTTFVNSPVVT